MRPPETPDRSTFAVFGGFAGLIVTGAAAMGFVYLAGDLGRDARLLRVGAAAMIGAGVGAYLGNTRRAFISDCAARFVRPVTAICHTRGWNRERLRSVLQLSLAGLIVAAWLVWIVGPDWRLHRIIDRLQSTDTKVSQAAVRELKLWNNGGIAALDRERNQMLAGLLNDQRAAVRGVALDAFMECKPDMPASQVTPALLNICLDADPDSRGSAAYALAQMKADPVRAVPALIRLLRDPYAGVRCTAAFALGEFGTAAQEAVPALAQLLDGANEGEQYSAIVALGDIHSNPEAAVPALLRVFDSSERSYRARASEALAAFGRQAAAAIPTLKQELTCGDYWRASSARDALLEIDPQQFEELFDMPLAYPPGHGSPTGMPRAPAAPTTEDYE
jgi:hypothetical protein